MKRIGIAVVLLGFLGACKKECKTFTYVPMAPLMQEYFGNYKPGNYWIYLNRDSTKRDSMWVDSFRIEPTGDRQFSCTSGEDIYFNLHTKYWVSTDFLRASITRNGQDMYSNLLYMRNVDQWDIFRIFVQKEDTSVFSLGGDPAVFLTNYILWPSNPQVVYPEAVQWGAVAISPGIGVIQYVPLGTTDTFSLIRFFKQ